MATTQAVREAIAAQVQAANPNVNVYAFVPDNLVTPAVIVMTGPKNYDETMGRGLHRHEFTVTVIAGRVDAQASQDLLDSMSDPTGDWSIPAALAADPTLDSLVPIVEVKDMGGYSPVTVGNVDYLKADFTLSAVY